MEEIIRKILIRGLITFAIFMFILVCGTFWVNRGFSIDGVPQPIFDEQFSLYALIITAMIVVSCILAIICSVLWELSKPKLKEYNFMGKNLYYVMLKALKVSGGLIVVYLFILDILERASSNVVNDKTIPMIALSIFGILVLTIIGNMAFVALSYYWKKVKSSRKKARQ
jgi:hypothetical protein